MRSASHDEAMAEYYREHPEFAIQMLNSILEDGELAELPIVLRQMTKAFGGVQVMARRPLVGWSLTLSNLSAILNAMGLQLVVQRVGAD